MHGERSSRRYRVAYPYVLPFRETRGLLKNRSRPISVVASLALPGRCGHEIRGERAEIVPPASAHHGTAGNLSRVSALSHTSIVELAQPLNADREQARFPCPRDDGGHQGNTVSQRVRPLYEARPFPPGTENPPVLTPRPPPEPSALEMHATKKPEYKQDNYDQTQHASETGAAVTPVPVVSPAPAK